MQQADNIDLYKRLLDLSAQALDLQAENARLKEENADLKRKKAIIDRIIRHREPVITLKDETPTLFYCAHCYDSEQKLIQVRCDYEYGEFYCPHCNVNGIFDSDIKARPKRTNTDANDQLAYLSFDPYGL